MKNENTRERRKKRNSVNGKEQKKEEEEENIFPRDELKLGIKKISEKK